MAAVIPRKISIRVWIILEVLLGASYGLSRIDMGVGDIILPLLLSSAQMVLVILYFMHARHSEHVVWVYILMGFLWFGILVDLSMADYITRGFAWWLGYSR